MDLVQRVRDIIVKWNSLLLLNCFDQCRLMEQKSYKNILLSWRACCTCFFSVHNIFVCEQAYWRGENISYFIAVAYFLFNSIGELVCKSYHSFIYTDDTYHDCSNTSTHCFIRPGGGGVFFAFYLSKGVDTKLVRWNKTFCSVFPSSAFHINDNLSMRDIISKSAILHRLFILVMQEGF